MLIRERIENYFLNIKDIPISTKEQTNHDKLVAKVRRKRYDKIRYQLYKIQKELKRWH